MPNTWRARPPARSTSPATWAPRAALVLTVVLLLSVSALAGLLVWLSFSEAIRAAETRAGSAAQLAASHARWIGEAAFQTLRRIDDALGEKADAFAAVTVGDLSASLSSLPVHVTIWVFNAQGQAIFANRPDRAGINVADRPYFQALRDGEEWHISPLLTDHPDEGDMFVIGRRIERDGRFLGVATIGVPGDLLSRFWTTLDLGPGSTVSLVREDGQLVARYPAPPGPMDLSGHVLFTRHLRQAPSGVYHNPVSPADGVARIVGYHRVQGLPLIAVSGVSRNAILERFRSAIGSVAVVAAPVALALLGSSFWVAGLLRRYERQRVELDEALERNRMLFGEIHHRVKNNLATALSLIQMHALPPPIKRDIRTQIGAMMAVHEQLYLSDQFGTIDLGAYIRRLVGNLRLSSAASVKVTCEADDIEVDVERAMPIGLIVNEVVTNACKHAFPNGRSGSVTIRLERIDGDSARIRIRDNGIGFEPERVEDGMGSHLVAGLSGQLGADYAFQRDGGTEFVMTFALSSATPAEA